MNRLKVHVSIQGKFIIYSDQFIGSKLFFNRTTMYRSLYQIDLNFLKNAAVITDQ